MSTSRAAALSLLVVTPALAQSVQEFLIPRANAFPHDPAIAEDGTAWYTDQNNSYIGRLDATTRTYQDWPTPTPGSGPHGITIAPDGYVWYTAQSTGRLGRVHPVTGAMTEYVLPANANRPHTPIAHKGVIWFTAQTNDTYGRFDPVTLQTQVWPAPSGSRPYGIVPAPDGSLWIALFNTNRLGRVDTTTGAIQLFDLPNTGARPRRLAVSNDGIVWYADFARGFLGRLDPTTRQVTEWSTRSGPYGISIGTDGRVWFFAGGGMVAFDPRTKLQQFVTIPTAGSTVRHMVTDWQRGDLWLALSGTRRLGLIALGAPAALYGKGCAGSLGVPQLSFSGTARIGGILTLDLRSTQAPAGVLFLGGSDQTWGPFTLPFDLAPLKSPGCLVLAAWDIALAAGAPGRVALSVPVVTDLHGLRFFLQWLLLLDPSGTPLVTTQGLRATVIGL